MAAVTSVGSSTTEQPRQSLPTGQTSGIVPQSRLHWRRVVSTAMCGGALKGKEREEDEYMVRLLEDLKNLGLMTEDSIKGWMKISDGR